MDELTVALRQHSQTFRPTEDAFQRVVQRGTRRQRTRRIGSAVVALGLFAVVDFGILRGLTPTHTTLTPGGPSNVPTHGTPSDVVVPGSNGYAPYIGVRPSGRGPHIEHDAADRPSSRRSTHPVGMAPTTGGASTATTDEDSTPRPLITQSLQVPHGTKGFVNSLNGDQGHPQLNKVDEKDGKGTHLRPCSTRKTPAARARCRARRHRGDPPGGVEIGPRLHVTDPGMPTVLPDPPADPATEPATPPVEDTSAESGTAPADAGSTADVAAPADATAAADAAPDATSSAPDVPATSDAAAL